MIDSNASRSCQDGISCVDFWSEPNVWRIAGFCSRIRFIIFYLEPHRVQQSVTNECRERFSSTWTFARSCLFFQEWEKAQTIFRQTPVAHGILGSSLIAVLTALCKLCPKHEIIVYSTPAKKVNQERKKHSAFIPWTYNLTQQQTTTG